MRQPSLPVVVMRKFLFFLLSLVSLAARPSDDEIVGVRITRAQGGLPDNNVREIYQDSVGFMYFSTHYSSYRYDGYSFSYVPDSVVQPLRLAAARQRKSFGKGYFSDNRGNGVTVSPDGMLEYVDRAGSGRIRMKVFDASLLGETDNIKCKVVTDGSGRIWVSVNGNGVFVYDKASRRMTHITRESLGGLLGSDYVVYMMEDRDGNIWLAVRNNGLVCMRAVRRQYAAVGLGAGAEEWALDIRMVSRLPGGSILVANKRQLFEAAPDLRSLRERGPALGGVLSAGTDGQGRLWLGTRFDGVYVDGVRHGSGRVDCLTADSRGRIWKCGIHGAVAMAALTAGGEYSERTFMLGNGGLTPHTMLLGKDGSMLVGAETGLYRFVPDSLLADTSAYQRLLPYPVYSLFADSKGRLWIGTHGHGVLTTDARGRYIRLTAKDGLPNDVVQSVGEDRHGRICITTQDGAVYYSPSTRKMEYLYFHNDPKLNFFSENCALRLADGRMLFGTLGGLVVVNRDFRPSTRVPQQVDVTEVSVDGVPSWTLPQTGRAGADGGGRTLVVGHDESSVVFRFSNFNYLRLQPTHYSYMLEGCDKNWSAATELNFASYNDLPPGKYVFRVRCLGDDGTWTEPRAAFALTVLPPWWASPAAFAVYCVVLFLAAMVAYRYLHTVYRLRRDIAVEKRLTQFKLDFFTNISHEFRTPLTLIAGSMERIRQVGGSIGDLRMPIDRMQRSVDRMLRLVNQLLEFRRMQEDRLHLSLELTEVVGFLRGIADSFHDVAEGKGVALRFAPQCKRWEVFVDRGFLDKIVYELLNNAIKYTPAGGSVDLRLRNDGGSMVVMVADTGVGVPADKRAGIFDRYSTGNQSRGSLGIGLNLVAGLVAAHHGVISLDDNAGGGSVFTVSLPVAREAYAEGDFMAADGVAPGPANAGKAFVEPVAELQMPPMNDKTVLVVDDDADVRGYLAHELGRYFTVVAAADGQEAMARLGLDGGGGHDSGAGTAVDLVVSDVRMPRMGGMELCRHIRSCSRTRGLPVILLTALGDVGTQAKGYDVGADAYVTKPFSLRLLVAQCRRLMERGMAGGANAGGQGAPPAGQPAAAVVTDERDHRLKEQIVAYAEAHIADAEFSADRFADGMGMGRSAFFAKFKSLTGKSPNEYLRELRLSRAAELLSAGPVTAAEVAYQVGMKTPQYFSTCFKKRFGVTPAQWQAGMRAAADSHAAG